VTADEAAVAVIDGLDLVGSVDGLPADLSQRTKLRLWSTVND
jgi:hypothetical protein